MAGIVTLSTEAVLELLQSVAAEVITPRFRSLSSSQIDATGPAYDAARAAFTEAWDGTAPVDMGVGGSIPFIAEFLEAFPEASVLVTGVEDPDTRAHGANEGLHLAEFERVVLAEALLLRNLARRVVVHK